MNILFITPRGYLSPSVIKRVTALRSELRVRGMETREIALEWPWLWDLRGRIDRGDSLRRMLMQGMNAARLTSSAIALRERRLDRAFDRGLRWADVIVVHRVAVADAWRAKIAHASKRVVFEFDDAIWLENLDGFEAMINLADDVVAGNEFLARHARQLGALASVIPTCVDLTGYRPPAKRAPGGFCVGWLGSPSTVRYLKQLAEPLARVARGRDVVLDLVGIGSEDPAIEGPYRVRASRDLPYEPRDHLHRFDVGIMPLVDGEHERGKCGAKLLDYMAAGLPTVASRVGVNGNIVDHGSTGYLADSPDEWAAVLEHLAEDEGLRRSLGQAGRAKAEKAYSLRTAADLWQRLLSSSVRSDAADQPALCESTALADSDGGSKC